MVANAGYSFVEGHSAILDRDQDIETLQRQLSNLNLTMPIAQFGFSLMQTDPQWVLEVADCLGVKVLVLPDLAQPLRPKTRDGWLSYGHLMADVTQPMRDAGIQIAYHNQAFEFEKLPGGEIPLDLIMEVDPELMLEFDPAWAQRAGQDPEEWLKRFTGRTISAHVKDLAGPGQNLNEDGWADVGHGTMNWTRLWAALDLAAVKYRVVEHNQPADHWRFADRAIDAVRELENQNYR